MSYKSKFNKFNFIENSESSTTNTSSSSSDDEKKKKEGRPTRTSKPSRHGLL